MTWEQLHALIAERATESASWQSNLRDLQFIFRTASDWGISSERLQNAGVSNLRTIVRQAKQAISEGNQAGLEALFELASIHTTADLRITLEISDRDIVLMKSRVDGEELVYDFIGLTPAQAQRIIRATKGTFDFQGDVPWQID